MLLQGTLKNFNLPGSILHNCTSTSPATKDSPSSALVRPSPSSSPLLLILLLFLRCIKPDCPGPCRDRGLQRGKEEKAQEEREEEAAAAGFQKVKMNVCALALGLALVLTVCVARSPFQAVLQHSRIRGRTHGWGVFLFFLSWIEVTRAEPGPARLNLNYYWADQ